MANPAIRTRPSPVTPAGTGKTPWRATLEAGARVLQDMTPLKDFDVYVAGLHCARHDPAMQMEAHHYCKQVNEDLLQCLIFDGNTREANLIGIEYIVSERLFETLPEGERGFWHPHNYEILSGQLVAPGLPEVAERAFMRLLMNSYGKTWHTWHTGRHDQPEGGERLPMGEAMLMWSFNRDGESDEALKADFQAGIGIEEMERRAKREGLTEHAHPQEGVDAMAGEFAGTTPLRGVVDKADRSTG
jgi:uncharacterized protein DUF1264